MNIRWRVGFLLVLAWALRLPAADDKAAKEKPKFKMSAAERQVLELTNKERKKAGLKPLKPNPVLFAVARGHSANMAKKGEMKHKLDGKEVDARADDAGYDFASIGENIAKGEEATPKEVMKGWMKSKGHRENILAAKYQEIGIGIAEGKEKVLYYTQVFGTPQPKK
jgi:uncharacterized protein YkwD